MTFTLAHPLALVALAATAMYLMTSAGIAKKRITVRGKVCPVCHRPTTNCTCRWR